MRNFWLVTRGKAKGAAAKWIKFVRSQQGREDHRQELGPAQIVDASAARAAGRPGTRLAEALRKPWSDRRTELVLGVLACSLLVLIAGMVVFVFANAWPSFSNNGLAWFGSGGNVDQQLGDVFNSPANPDDYVYELRAWPLLYGTFLTTAGAVVMGIAISLFAAIFIVEFAPPRLQQVLEPVVRLLAAVPSVIYGLIGVLVIVPFVGNHLISEERKESVAFVVQLTGSSLIVAVRDPHGDDHADHDRDHRRRAALGAARVDRGRRGARASTAGA